MLETVPMSSVQLLADSTAADDTLRRCSFHCLRNSFTMGVNKTHTDKNTSQKYNYKSSLDLCSSVS